MTLRNKPNLFILGAPKCGTTAMAHYLSRHPAIYVSKVKEPHFFNTDSQNRYFMNLEPYEDLFNGLEQSYEYYCEASVWYLYSEVAVKNILEYNPDSKFIVMLRDPVKMFFSLHQELYFGGTENIRNSKKSWELQEERKLGKIIPSGCKDSRMLQYRDICSLGYQCKKLLEQVDRKNVHFVKLEDMAENPHQVYAEVLRFLGLGIIKLDSYEIVNPKKKRRSYWLNNFFIRWTGLKKKLGIKGGIGLANWMNRKNVKSGIKLYDEGEPIFIEELKFFFKKDQELLEECIYKS